MKRLILTILILLTTISASFGAYNYNDTYTNLYLDSNGWCANLEIQFHVFNMTDYENKEIIEDDLCEPGCVEDCNWDDDEDCIECEWECAEFDYIEGATIKIYDGPLDSLPLLLQTTTNATGQFKYTFPSPQQHLIEIFPDEDENPNYNDFHQIYDLYQCGHAQNTTIKELNPLAPKDVEIEYPLQGIKLSVKQTTLNGTGAFTIDETISMPKPLENTIRHFELTAINGDFDTVEMSMMTENITAQQTTTTLKWYNLETSNWENKNFRTQNENIIFDATNLGIYAITQITETPHEEPIIEEETPQNQEQQNQEQQQQIEDEPEIIENNNNFPTLPLSKNMITGIVGGILLLIIIIIFFAAKSRNNQKHYHENKNSKTPQQPDKQVLTTYEATYQQAKKYTQQYKEKYGKDSLYRALKEANVPKDIIDKVFAEEY